MVNPDPVVGDVTGPRGLVAGALRENRAWFIALGLGFLVLGVLAISLPFAASLVTTFVFGWLMIIGGLFQGIHALQNRRWAGSTAAIFGAILYVVAGVLLILRPLAGTLTLTLVLAAFFTVNGFVKVWRAIQHRAMPRWGWLLFDGLLTLTLGVLILLQWPSAAVWALGLLVGVDLIAGGFSMLMIGLAAGPQRHTTEAEAHA